MKRFIAAVLAIVLIFTSADFTALAEELTDNVKTSGDYVYEYVDDAAKITAYTGNEIFVKVPAALDDVPVTSIGTDVFTTTPDIRGIEIPEGVEKIEQGAFSNLSNLEYISLPASVAEIGENVLPEELENCTYLVVKNTPAYEYVSDQGLSYVYRSEDDPVSDSGETGDVFYHFNHQLKKMYIYGEGAMADYNSSNMPWYEYKSSIEKLEISEGVAEIGNYAFCDCTKLRGELVIPSSVTKIENGAFYGCTGLSNLTLSENLTSIGSYAFYNCSGLVGTLTIPDSVTSINSYAFYNCFQIEHLVLGSSLDEIAGSSYSYQPFYGMSGVKTVMFKKETPPGKGYTDIFYSMNNLETVYVPAEGYSAYMEKYSAYINNGKIVMDSDEDLVIQDGVLLQYTGEEDELVIPDEVTEIGQAAFKNNTTIESITLGANVKKIGKDAFRGAGNLRKFVWNDAIEEIGEYAFYGCVKMKGDLSFSSTVTSIGQYAFYNCNALTSVEIAGNDEEFALANYVLAECDKLESVTLGNVTSIGQYAFAYSDLLENVDLGTVTTINNYAFYDCDGLEEINLKQVKTIKDYVFAECSVLKTVQLQSVETIGTYAFYSCIALAGELVIPDTVTNVGTYAFYNCTGLTGITFSKNMTQISQSCFVNCTGLNGTLVIPDNIKTIDSYAFQTCSKVEHLVFGSGLTNIYGSGYSYQPFYGMSGVKTVTFKGETPPATSYTDIFYSMNNLEYIYVPVTSYSSYVSKFSSYVNNARIISESDEDLVVEDGVLIQYTGEAANVVLPDEVEEIGASVFKNHKGIESVTFGANVKKIDADAFRNCTNLKTIVFNEALEEIGNNAFNGCTSLEGSLTIPEAVKAIGNYSFNNCDALTELIVKGREEGLTIGTYAFAECNLLEKISLGNVNDISTYAFYNNDKLVNVDLGKATYINSYAFYDCDALTSIDLQDVKTIENDAFRDCSALKSVDLRSVEKIGSNAFYYCTALEGELVIPDTVTSIGSAAFYNCNKLTGLKLSENLTTITSSAFSSCSGLMGELVIPDSVTTIESYAFQYCSKVESIVLGTGLKNIYGSGYSYQPFYNMSGVKTVTFKSEVPPYTQYTDIFYAMNNLETIYVPGAGYAAYAEKFNAYINNAKMKVWDSDEEFIIENDILYAYLGEDTEVTIPDGIKSIHTAAFKNNTTLEKVIFNESLISIGQSAFENSSVKEIVFNDALETIGHSAFRSCDELEEIILSKNLLTLASYAFEGCKKLETVTLPENKEKITIDSYAFSNCQVLKQVQLGKTDKIGDYAFYYCTGLLDIDLKNVSSIGSYAFYNCDSLTEVDLKFVENVSTCAFGDCSSLMKLNLQSVKTIGANAFYYCTALAGELVIPDSVTSIGSSAFYNCPSITRLRLPENLTSISDSTFAYCSNLMGEIVIPDKVTSIGSYAFQYCSKVESIVLGTGLKNIYGSGYTYQPFYGMTGVKDVTFRSATPPNMQYADIFYSMNGLENVYVPADGRVAYSEKLHSYLNNAQIRVWDSEDDFICEDEVLISYQGKSSVVTIPEGIEEIATSAFQNNTTIEKVILGSDVEVIGNSAFQDCTNLKEIVWNEKLESIGTSAFMNCSNLEGKVEIPTSVEVIGNSAFRNCDKLTDIVIHGNAEDPVQIGEYAFYDNKLLTSVEFGNVESIGTYIFGYCDNLADVDFGDLETISAYAFYECDGLTSIDFRNVKTIANYAFYYCRSLATIDLRAVTNIDAYAFCNTGLSGKLVLPDSVTYLGNCVFQECKNITELKLSENLKDIPQYAFYYCTGLSGEVVVPDSVKGIGIAAFAYCSKVESLVLGSSVSSLYGNSSMSSHPFYYMSGVKTVAFRGLKTPASYHVDVFYSMNNLETIYVPAASYDAYVKMLDACKNNAVFSTDWLDYEVANFQASNIYSTTVKLTWSAHQNENVTGYVLLRDGEEIGSAKNTYFIDYELIPGQEYTYEVYGVTEDGDKTKSSKLKVTPEKMQFTELKTNHSGNKVALTDGKIYITAKKNANYTDLDGKLVAGRLYYIDEEGRRVFIGESTLTVKSDKLQFMVDWDVTEIEEGNYEVIFVYEDIDGTVSDITGNVEVYKTVPEKIVNVVAVGDYNSIVLSWSKSSEADSTIYHIYRKSEVDEKFTLLKTITNRNTLSYTDSTVRIDRKYSYYVVTENSFGITSEKSDEAVAMKAIDTEAPIVTKITPVTSSFISEKVTITVEADDNLKATGAKLYYSTDGNEWIAIGEDISAPFSFLWNVSSLEDGEVTVKAVAYDAQGNESEGRKVTYKIDNSGPAAVTGLTASTILSSKLTLKWDDSTAADAAGFILEQKEADGEFKVVASKITTLGYNLENLKPGTTYTFRVAAYDTQGNKGDYSEEYSVTTTEDTTAPVITKLSPDASRKNSTIAFSATAGDDCGVQKISIQISQDRKEWKTVSYGTYSIVQKVATYSFSVPVDEFEDGSLYVRAVAEDFSGNVSDTSDAAAFVEYMIDKSAPDSPRDLMACGGDGYIYLSWLQGEEEDLSTYSVYRSTSEKDGFTLLASNLSKLNYYDTSAERGTTYYYKIAVRDTVGNISAFSEVVSAQVAQDITPPEIVSISPADSSNIGPEYHTVSALVKDNNCLQSVTFEYKLAEKDDYQVLKVINDIGYYYKTVQADIPLDGLKNGDIVYVRVFCRDISGYTSEYSYEYHYYMDNVAPAVKDLKYSLNKNEVLLTWKDNLESDLSGFRIYRIHANGTENFLGTRVGSGTHSYQFYDYLPEKADGEYSYRIDTFDKVGNKNTFFTDVIHYEYEEPGRVNQAPVAVINGMETMEIGVEEFFDASASTDDGSIVSYRWDFGDGTSSREMKAVKKYKASGTYEVKLTVTDNEGESSEAVYSVKVAERTSVGVIKVKVVDDNGAPMSQAPVYYNLGTEKQKVVYTDGTGTATYNMENGEFLVGCYKTGYLPASKSVKVLPNATRTVTLVMIEENIVSGEFEVTRMTFSEIKEAGIDVYDPENQNVYSVRMTIKYGDSEIPIEYIRNDNRILDYSVGSSTGGGRGGGGGGGGTGGGGGGRGFGGGIAGLGFVPNEQNIEIVAVLQMDMAASTVKEFFDVKLHIINNAESKFLLKDNSVELHVPDGMSLMTGLIGEWSDTEYVEFDKLYGQETETTSWVLRGDEVGEYDLTADYKGTLDLFEEPVEATFETEEPIKVYGMSDFVFDVEVNSEIRYNAFYFNIGLKNDGVIDYYNPTLDFDGMVSNITHSTYEKAHGNDEGAPEEEDFDMSSRLLNVRHVSADGTEEYVTYTVDDNGQIDTEIDTLSPGEVIYYEYVAYNMINYDKIAYFNEAVYEELEGVGGGVDIRVVDMDLFSFMDAPDKAAKLKKKNSAAYKGAEYLLDDSKYIAVANSDMVSAFDAAVYDTLKLVLTLDFKVLTDEEKRDVIDQMLISMVTDESLYSNIDDMVNSQYISGVKSVLEFLKQVTDDIKFENTTDKTKWIAMLNDTLKNRDKLNRLVDATKSQSGEDLEQSFMEIIGLEVITGIGMAGYTTFKVALGKALKMHPDSALLKGLSGAGKYGGMIIDYGLLTPLEAYESSQKTTALYALIQMQACKEEAVLLMNTVMEFFAVDNAEIFDSVMSHVMTMGASTMYNAIHKDYKKLIREEAKDMKKLIIDNTYKQSQEFVKKLTQYTLEKVGKQVIEKAIAKMLGKANIWYLIIGTAFEIGAYAWKLEQKTNAAESFAIAAYLSLAVSSGYKTFRKAYGDKATYKLLSDSKLCEGVLADGETLNDERAATYLLYQAKYLTRIRLIGEEAFYNYIKSDNGTPTKSDEDHDEDVRVQLNKIFGTTGKSIEEIFDMVYGNILEHRDTMFNIEQKVQMEKPEAPEVTIDYENLCTVQEFDDSYEYCLADGEWRECEGGTIKITPKTHTTVLRVRKASAKQTMAGEITTVTIYAKKNLPKIISVKYTDGKYYFKNLNAKYEYEAVPVDSMKTEPEWENAQTFKGSASAYIFAEESDYIALRTLLNDELYEMTSEPSIYSVGAKEYLTVITEGNGSVSQTASNGLYFNGDDVTLIANPASGSKFVGWYLDNELVSKDAKYILEMYPYAEIRARFDDGTVRDPESVTVTSINRAYSMKRSNIPDLTIYTGEQTKLLADVQPEAATNKEITWSSSNPDILQVTGTGVITAVSAGNATITAVTNNGCSSSYSVEVVDPVVTELRISRMPSVRTYFEGSKLDTDGLKVIAEYNNGTTEVVEDYEITGYDAFTIGEQVLTITYKEGQATFTVTVKHDAVWNDVSDSSCSKAGELHKICKVCETVVDTKEKPLAEHTYEWVFGEGVKELTCKDCGDVKESETIEAHNHQYDEISKEASCDEDGYVRYTCSVCEHSYEEVIQAAGHTYEEKVIEETCARTGYTVKTCQVCGEKEFTDLVEKKEHVFKERTVEASCAGQGYDEIYCENCDYSEKSNYTEQLEHSYYTEYTEASCEHGSGTKYACENCDYFYVDEESEAIGHNYEETVYAANCVDSGYSEYVCSYCNDTYRDKIVSALGHSFGNWMVKTPSTEEVKGVLYRVCNICHEEETKRIDKTNHTHVAGEWEKITAAGCTEYGVEAAKCMICNEMVETKVIEPTGHQYEQTVTESDCTNKGCTTYTCEHCGDTYITDISDAKGHEPGEQVVEKATCSAVGSITVRCNVCQAILEQEILPVEEHTINGWTTDTAAAVGTDGKQVKKCEVCNWQMDEKDITGLKEPEILITKYQYTGSEIIPELSVLDMDGNELIPEADYTLHVSEKPVATGKYSITVEYIGKYEGNRTLHYAIEPAGPAKLEGELICYNEVMLTWSASEGAESYQIYYKEATDDVYTKVGDTEKTSYEITSLKADTQYTFKVVPCYQADTKLVESSFVSSVNIATEQNKLKVTGVKAQLNGYDEVKVSWEKVDKASGYYVYYKKDSDKTYTNYKRTTELSSEFTNLDKGVKYQFKVVPYKEVNGENELSTEYAVANIWTLKKLNAPVVEKSNDSTVKVTWNNIEGETGYQISRSTSSTGTEVIDTYGTTSAVSKTFATTVNVKYYYKVRPYVTVDGDTIYGPWSEVTAYNLIYVGGVSNTKAVLEKTYNSINISWEAAVGANRYDIYARYGSEAYSLKASTTELNKTISELAAGETYTFKVVPVYVEGGNVLKEGAAGVTTETTLKKLNAPKVTRSSSTKVKVTWQNISGETGYEISQSTSKTGTSIKDTVETTTGTYKTLAAANCKNFYYKVRAYKTVNGTKIYGPWSEVTSYKLITVGKVTNTKAVLTKKHNCVKVSWKKTTGANRYDIYVKYGSKGYALKAKATGLSKTISGLKEGVTYTFKVVPVYAENGKILKKGTFGTSKATTLKKLSAPKVTRVSATKVKVAWKNISGETGYQISCSTSKTGTSIKATAVTTTGKNKTIKVTKGKKLYYKVRAYKTVNGTKIYGPWSKVTEYKNK